MQRCIISALAVVLLGTTAHAGRWRVIANWANPAGAGVPLYTAPFWGGTVNAKTYNFGVWWSDQPATPPGPRSNPLLIGPINEQERIYTNLTKVVWNVEWVGQPGEVPPEYPTATFNLLVHAKVGGRAEMGYFVGQLYRAWAQYSCNMPMLNDVLLFDTGVGGSSIAHPGWPIESWNCVPPEATFNGNEYQQFVRALPFGERTLIDASKNLHTYKMRVDLPQQMLIHTISKASLSGQVSPLTCLAGVDLSVRLEVTSINDQPV